METPETDPAALESAAGLHADAEAVPQEQQANADANTHGYLGDFLLHNHNRNYFSVDETIEVPLLILREVVLFPGDTLPLRIHRDMNAGLFAHFRDNMQSALNTIGVATRLPNTEPPSSPSSSSSLVSSVGLTVDILSYHTESADEIVLVAKGRQRFSVLKLHRRVQPVPSGQQQLPAVVTFAEARVLSDSEPVIAPHMDDSAVLGDCYVRGGAAGSCGSGSGAVGWLQQAVNPFPQWVYDLRSPVVLSLRAYGAYTKSLEWQDDGDGDGDGDGDDSEEGDGSYEDGSEYDEGDYYGIEGDEDDGGGSGGSDDGDGSGGSDDGGGSGGSDDGGGSGGSDDGDDGVPGDNNYSGLEAGLDISGGGGGGGGGGDGIGGAMVEEAGSEGTVDGDDSEFHDARSGDGSMAEAETEAEAAPTATATATAVAAPIADIPNADRGTAIDAVGGLRGDSDDDDDSDEGGEIDGVGVGVGLSAGDNDDNDNDNDDVDDDDDDDDDEDDENVDNALNTSDAQYSMLMRLLAVAPSTASLVQSLGAGGRANLAGLLSGAFRTATSSSSGSSGAHASASASASAATEGSARVGRVSRRDRQMGKRYGLQRVGEVWGLGYTPSEAAADSPSPASSSSSASAALPAQAAGSYIPHVPRALYRHVQATRHPVKFSYYLASNLPISDREKLALLSTETVEERLRLLIEIIASDIDSILCCCRCRQPLARRTDIFSVPGADGMVGAYVNPHGVVHQTVTVRSLLDSHCYALQGARPTTQDTWFPGYGWTIAACGRCYNHIGWLFTLLEDGQTGAGAGAGGDGSAAACSSSQSPAKRQRSGSSSISGDAGSSRSRGQHTYRVKSFWGLRRAGLELQRRRQPVSSASSSSSL